MQPVDSLARRLLVATPSLLDPNFRHAVVLVLEHGDEGAFGVVVNRPSPLAVRDVLPAWADLAAEPAVVFVGGPVAPDTVLALASRGDGQTDAWQPLLGRLGLVDLVADPLPPPGALEGLRVIGGHAGWGPGQLEAEIEQGSWFVVDPEPADVVADDPDGLWRRVLVRRGGVYTTIPADPGQN
ncbi:MAG: YqgE/AlgH family protein [Actinomycetota bacterium]|nr:YqgE/AlgH family protein [Actinomycetota bacterium]